MTLEEHAHAYAKDMLGNRKHATDAVFDLDDEIDMDQYVMVEYNHRDADMVTRSNAVQFEALAENFEKPEIFAVHAKHWAVGWVDVLFVRPYDEQGVLTLAFLALTKLLVALEDYPLLDEMHYSELERDEQVEALKWELALDDLEAEVVWRKLWDEPVQFDIFEESALTGQGFSLAQEIAVELGFIECADCSNKAFALLGTEPVCKKHYLEEMNDAD